jgi:hypothetical protein
LAWLVLDLRDGDPSSDPHERRGEPDRHLALAKSLRISPDVVAARPAQLDVWLQHFDPLKGTPLCLVDSHGGSLAESAASAVESPSSGSGGGQAGEGANGGLLRRLGLGGPTALGYSNSSSSSGGGGRGGPALRLAAVLAAEGFPSIAVLGGSFAQLVQEVQRQQGRLEPLVIDLREGSAAAATTAATPPQAPAARAISSRGVPPAADHPAAFLSAFGSLSGRALALDLESAPQRSSPAEDAHTRRLSGALRVAEARGHGTAALLLRRKLGVDQPLATAGELVQVQKKGGGSRVYCCIRLSDLVAACSVGTNR